MASFTSTKGLVMRIVRERRRLGSAAVSVEEIANDMEGERSLEQARRACRALVELGRLVDVGGEVYELAQ